MELSTVGSRLAAMAIALGVGVAVTNSPGLAHAGPSDTDGSSDSSSVSRSERDSSRSSTGSSSPGSSADSPGSDVKSGGSRSGSRPTSTRAESDSPNTTDEDHTEPAKSAKVDRGAEPDAALDEVATVGPRDHDGAMAQPVGNAVSARSGAAGRAQSSATSQPVKNDSVRSHVVTADPPRPGATPAKAIEPADVVAETVEPHSVSPAVTAVPAATSATPAEPVMPVARLVIGVLSAFGLAPPSTGAPTVPLRPPFLLGALQLLLRDTRFAVANRLPSAHPVETSQGEGGVVTGTVGAVDPEADPLTYQVTDGPAHGTVVVNAFGTYTYVADPDFEATGGTDTFTVTVDDDVRSLIELDPTTFPGFRLNLFSDTGTISVPVRVTVEPRVSVQTVAVGAGPSGVAASSDGTRVYVTNASGNSVSVIDTSTKLVIATIADVGNFPVALAVSPDDRWAYVANAYGGTVAVIDTTTNSVTATFDVGSAPAAVVVSSDGRRVYVANAGTDDVTVIDTVDGAVIATVAVGATPEAVALSTDGSRAYVANAQGNSVSVIDTATNTVAAVIGLDGATTPGGLAVSPDGRRVYVVGYQNGTVSVIDAARNAVINTFDVASSLDSVAISPDGTRLYATSAAAGTVSVIDAAARSVIGVLALGGDPDAVAVGPDGDEIYAANFAGGEVSVISIARGSATGPAVGVQAAPTTRGFDVYNLTQYPLRFTGYGQGAEDVESGPVVGTLVQPGQAAHFEVIFTFFGDNYVDANFERPSEIGGTYTASMYVLSIFASTYGGCSTSGGAPSCSPRDVLAGARQVFFLDAPGTVVDIGAGGAQTNALNNLCYNGSPATCDFKATRQELTYTAYRPVGASYTNPNPYEGTISVSTSEAVSQSDSVQISTKAGFKLFDIINAEIQTTYGHTWTRQVTFTYKADAKVPPYTKAYFTAADPVYRVYGDFTLTVGNSTWILRDTYFDTPDTNRIPDLKPVYEPLPPPLV